jgi:hypothetical protein
MPSSEWSATLLQQLLSRLQADVIIAVQDIAKTPAAAAARIRSSLRELGL